MSDVRITSGLVRIFTFGAGYAVNTITNQTSNLVYKESPWTTFQATIVGTGVVSAAVTILCSNDGINWNSTVLGTITLNGTTTSTDGFSYIGPWKYVAAVVSSITGTGATVNVSMGV